LIALPSLGLLTINSLTAAHSVIIPLQCEYYALEGLGQLLKTIRLIKQSLNPRLEIEGILLTMFDGRNNLSHQVAQEVKKHFKDKVFTTIIPRNIRLSEAPSHGKPVLLYDIHSKGAESYLNLGQRNHCEWKPMVTKRVALGKGLGVPSPRIWTSGTKTLLYCGIEEIIPIDPSLGSILTSQTSGISRIHQRKGDSGTSDRPTGRPGL